MSQARTLGINEATRVREMLNAEKYREIYDSATGDFKQTITERKWIATCADLRLKLGRWKQSTVKDTQVFVVESGGYLVTVAYATDFETGPANETLVFLVKNGKAQLHSYNVNSPSLSRTDVGANVVETRAAQSSATQ